MLVYENLRWNGLALFSEIMQGFLEQILINFPDLYLPNHARQGSRVMSVIDVKDCKKAFPLTSMEC